jgi:DNA polymerase III epsilon subunit-like protein
MNKSDILLDIYSKMNIDEIRIIYKVNNGEIKLFGNDFVKNNKNNCKLIIDGKEQELKEFYKFSLFGEKKSILEIKLKNITKITNMSNIFSKCSSLLKIPNIDERVIILETINTGPNPRKNNILEISCMEMMGGKITGYEFDAYLHPRYSINEVTKQKTNLNNNFY